MVGQHCGGQEEKRKMKGLCRFHGPKQGMLKRPVPYTSDRPAGGCHRGTSSDEFLRCLPGLSSDTTSPGRSKEDRFRDTCWELPLQGDALWLEDAGSTYQRMMTRMFEPLLGKSIEIYVDDMVVKSKVVSEHLEDLGYIFNVLRKHKQIGRAHV